MILTILWPLLAGVASLVGVAVPFVSSAGVLREQEKGRKSGPQTDIAWEISSGNPKLMGLVPKVGMVWLAWSPKQTPERCGEFGQCLKVESLWIETY